VVLHQLDDLRQLTIVDIGRENNALDQVFWIDFLD
jgi:hypothetical protein